MEVDIRTSFSEIIDKAKENSIVGIGLGSYGTKEHVEFQYNIIRRLTEDIIIFLESDYFETKFFSQLSDNLTESDLYQLVTQSNLLDHHKSIEYMKIFWYCYQNKIPIIGFQCRTFPLKVKGRFEKKLRKYFKLNKKYKIHEIIFKRYSKKYDRKKIIYLAHNVEISKPEFIGLSIATTSLRGHIGHDEVLRHFDFLEMNKVITSYFPVFDEGGRWSFLPSSSFDFVMKFIESNILSSPRKEI